MDNIELIGRVLLRASQAAIFVWVLAMWPILFPHMASSLPVTELIGWGLVAWVIIFLVKLIQDHLDE